VATLRAALPGGEVERRRPIEEAEFFIINRPESAVGWGRSRVSALRVPVALLSECRDEADVGALIVAAVPRLRAGELVEIKPPSESRLRVIPGWRA
jgi:hypothetical protein